VSDWSRPHFESGGGDALVFYVVFGADLEKLQLSAKEHRTRGLPEGVGAWARDSRQYDDLLRGYLGSQLDSTLPDLSSAVKESTKCVLVRGEVRDPPTLDFLRDVIGVITAFLDRGVALLDAQSFRWWSGDSWRHKVFAPDAPTVHQHVVILESEYERDRIWVHTRGLRKFGRPDLSIHGVTPRHRDAVHDLCDRFIELQALGGVIPEGTPVRMKRLPEGLTCHHEGTLEDPEFNNVHVEIRGLA
jgi:hypothetical protein